MLVDAMSKPPPHKHQFHGGNGEFFTGYGIVGFNVPLDTFRRRFYVSGDPTVS